MVNSTPKWRSYADRNSVADKRLLKHREGRTIFGHWVPPEPNEDHDGVQVALQIIKQAKCLHESNYNRDPDGTEPPWPDSSTAGEIYRIVQTFQEDRAICDDMPRVSHIRHRIRQIGLHAKETRRHLETADQFALWKIFEALRDRWLSYEDPGAAGEIIRFLKEDHSSLINGRASLIGLVLGALEHACDQALNTMPEDRGGDGHPFGWSPEADFVITCLKMFDIHCPSVISASDGSHFREFVAQVDLIATSGTSQCGRKIKDLVKRHKAIAEQQRRWHASPEGLRASYSHAYEKRCKCEAILKRAAESGADSELELQEEMEETRRQLAWWRRAESVLKHRLNSVSKKI